MARRVFVDAVLRNRVNQIILERLAWVRSGRRLARLRIGVSNSVERPHRAYAPISASRTTISSISTQTTSREAEDALIRRVAAPASDIGVSVEPRNQGHVSISGIPTSSEPPIHLCNAPRKELTAS